MRYKEVSAK